MSRPDSRPRCPHCHRALRTCICSLAQAVAHQQAVSGSVVVEVSTRRAENRAARVADLAEALAVARLHLVAQPVPREASG